MDTGATDSVVPRDRLEAIGVKSAGQRTYELADGRQVRMEVAVARIEFMDEFVGGTVVFGEAGAEPLLGATALESMGVEVDPRNQELRKSSTVRLKTTRASSDTTVIKPVEYTMPISALTVDKLGVKLYDRASAVIAELLSNSYDADATEAKVCAPLGKYLATVVEGKLRDKGYALEISDNGLGMTPREMDTFFLPVGMERRDDPDRGSTSKRFSRKVMGRKGVGKLAPFGICKVIEVKSAGGDKITCTTVDGCVQTGYLTSHVILNYDDIVQLGRVPSETYRPRPGDHDCTISPKTGTTITLRKFYRKRIPGVAPAWWTRSIFRDEEESTMPKKRKQYPLEYRRRMVDLARSGRSPEALAREFEPSAPTIRNWVEQADLDEGRRDDGTTTRERDELRRLKRENKQLRLERDILKKAAAWFARESGSIPGEGSSS